MDVTREQLTDALDSIMVDVRSGSRVYPGKLSYPDLVATGVIERIAARQRSDDDVVDAHICCDHADREVSIADIAGSHADTELALMAAILHGMDQLDRDARQRIRNWVDERFVPGRANSA